MHMAETLWIGDDAWAQMRVLADERYPLETGGLLVGYVADEGTPVVRAVVGPGPKAQHSRYGFSPDTEYQDHMLEDHHRSTNGVESYLGDWHTHPDGVAALSRRDKKTLRNIAAKRESYVARPVMAILEGSPASWRPAAFRLEFWRKRMVFVQYEITELVVRFFTGSSAT